MIETLRFDRHIGKVEWVTCQVPSSRVGVGGVKVEGPGKAAPVGGRSIIGEAIMGVAIVESDTNYGGTGVLML